MLDRITGRQEKVQILQVYSNAPTLPSIEECTVKRFIEEFKGLTTMPSLCSAPMLNSWGRLNTS